MVKLFAVVLLLVAVFNGLMAGDEDTVKLLVKYQADVNAKDNKGNMPLHIAVDHGNENIVEFLIKQGADVNATDDKGNMPLHIAAAFGHVNMTEFLIKHGADVKARNKNGFTPYDMAKTNDHAEVASILIKHGAEINTKHNNGLVYIIVGVVALILVSTISITILCVRMRRKNEVIRKLNAIELKCFEQGNVEGISSNLTLDEQADLLPYDKRYEFPRERLKLGAQLGGGAFGVVYEGIAHGILPNEEKTKVAVKMVKRMSNDEIMRALILELKIMVHLGQHLNLVNLLGAVTTNITRYDMMIIVEYCRYGCLQNVLIKSQSSFVDQIDRDTDTIISSTNATKPNVETSGCFNNDNYQTDYQSVINSLYVGDSNNGDQQSIVNSLYVRYSNSVHRSTDDVGTSSKLIDSESIPQVTTTDLLCWSFQISRGMHYLASCKVLHGDLAARNILLSNNNVIKICDFGLARSLYKTDVYRKNKEAILPFKWLALESIKDHVFSTHTDVWAFGVVLWELFSLGATPYPGLSGQDLYQKLLDGYRMEKPDFATQDIYDIMLACWRVNYELRPSFDELGKSFSKFLDPSVAERYVNLNEPYSKANVDKYENGKIDYTALMETPDFQAPSSPSGSALQCNELAEIHQQPNESSTIASDTSSNV